MKNKFIIGFLSGLLAISLFGCSGLLSKNKGTYGKIAKQEEVAAAKIDKPTDQLNAIKDQRLTSIGALSSGVNYSLNKVTNSEPAVDIAKQVNDRVKTLANKPSLVEEKEIFNIIDSLLTNAIAGQKMLSDKDKQIIKLQSNITELQTDREDAFTKYRNLAETAALKGDASTATLKEMNSFWGFGAITYGIKKFISRAAITLIVLLIVFVALRILATMNPIAASIFAIFEQIGSWVVSVIKKVLPKATSISGLVSTEDYQGYKTTLHKVIDAIEVVKEKESLLKKNSPGTCISMDDLSNEIAKSFDSQDSERVTTAKKELLWKM